MRSIVLGGLLGILTGCASQVTNYNELPLTPIAQGNLPPQGKLVSSALEEYFTQEALEVLADIEVTKGFVLSPYSGYALGANTWSRVGGFISGSGFSDKVVLSRNTEWTTNELNRTIVHEYLHHAVDRGLINMEAFVSAYELAQQDEKFIEPQGKDTYSPYHCVESAINGIPIQQDIFGVGDNEERMCTVGELLITGKYVPFALKQVYKGVIRKAHEAP